MRSAYQILGVPGNAGAEDIRRAYDDARRHVEAHGASVDKLNDLQNAFKILVDPVSRAAHDRKLDAARHAAPATDSEPAAGSERASAGGGALKWVLLGALLLGGVGYAYVSKKNAETRRQQAAAELAAREKQEQEAFDQRQAELRAQSERAQARAREEAEARRQTEEARRVGQQAIAERSRHEAQAMSLQRQAQMDAERKEANAQAERRRAEMEARNEARHRLAEDKQRIRELCYRNYGRPDC